MNKNNNIILKIILTSLLGSMSIIGCAQTSDNVNTEVAQSKNAAILATPAAPQKALQQNIKNTTITQVKENAEKPVKPGVNAQSEKINKMVKINSEKSNTEKVQEILRDEGYLESSDKVDKTKIN